MLFSRVLHDSGSHRDRQQESAPRPLLSTGVPRLDSSSYIQKFQTLPNGQSGISSSESTETHKHLCPLRLVSYVSNTNFPQFKETSKTAKESPLGLISTQLGFEVLSACWGRCQVGLKNRQRLRMKGSQAAGKFGVGPKSSPQSCIMWASKSYITIKGRKLLRTPVSNRVGAKSPRKGPQEIPVNSDTKYGSFHVLSMPWPGPRLPPTKIASNKTLLFEAYLISFCSLAEKADGRFHYNNQNSCFFLYTRSNKAVK